MHPETVNEVNANMQTPLHLAVQSAHTDSVDRLISCSSLDINAQVRRCLERFLDAMFRT